MSSPAECVTAVLDKIQRAMADGNQDLAMRLAGSLDEFRDDKGVLPMPISNKKKGTK